jgi:hypothetical protein
MQDRVGIRHRFSEACSIEEIGANWFRAEGTNSFNR